MSQSWGYCNADGPATWSDVAPAAKGTRQSPINIVPSEAKYDQSLNGRQFKIVYDPEKSTKIFNNGHSVQVAIDGDGSVLEGGPLFHQYKAAQFHFHWGKTSDRGSEHRINGKMYAAEGHIVHYNSDLFQEVGEAAKSENGLCVLGFFLSVGNEHSGFAKLSELLPKIQNCDDSFELEKGFDPAFLLPNNTRDYWTYQGSLTTPPCYESVTWVVFKEPIEVSEKQLTLLRSLKTTHANDPVPDDELHGEMVENYRPPLPLGGRLLRASFPFSPLSQSEDVRQVEVTQSSSCTCVVS